MKQTTESMQLNIYNEDGKLKSYDEFEKEFKELYSTLEKAIKDPSDMTFMEVMTNPELEFTPESVVEKYQFLERKLYLNTEILEETGQYFLERIQFWNSEDSFNDTPIEERIPIQIYIDSPGGLLTTSLLIIDAIKNSKTPIWTIVTGTAYSGAFFISIAGHKRYAFKNATFLFHEGAAGTMGDAHKVLQQSDFYKNVLLKSVKNHVIKSTTIPSALYEEHKKDDWYFDSKRAIKLGVIDEICNDVNGGIYDEE